MAKKVAIAMIMVAMLASAAAIAGQKCGAKACGDAEKKASACAVKQECGEKKACAEKKACEEKKACCGSEACKPDACAEKKACAA